MATYTSTQLQGAGTLITDAIDSSTTFKVTKTGGTAIVYLTFDVEGGSSTSVSSLSSTTFTGGSHCFGGLRDAQGLAVSGKTTATTTDDILYVWRKNTDGTIFKYNVNTGIEISRFARKGTGAGKTNNVFGLDVDSSGNIFAPEGNNNNARWVSKFDSDDVYVGRSPNPRAKRMEIAKLARVYSERSRINCRG